MVQPFTLLECRMLLFPDRIHETVSRQSHWGVGVGGDITPKGAKIRSLAGEKVLAITRVCGLLKAPSILTALE